VPKNDVNTLLSLFSVFLNVEVCVCESGEGVERWLVGDIWGWGGLTCGARVGVCDTASNCMRQVSVCFIG
jgi:hypothetical protein